MCIILAAWQADSEYPLVIAANRDEVFSRPARSAAFWPDAPDLLAGRDLFAGGTWLGITRSGRFAALTNVRDPAQEKPGATSRGALVSGFLQGTTSPLDYLGEIETVGSQYNGFNLLVGDGKTLACYNNVEHRSELLAPGIHGLSNHALNTPWPKVTLATAALQTSLGKLPSTDNLFDFLRDETVADDKSLPQTGVPQEVERMLSSIFVRCRPDMDFGTRNSTVLVVGHNGQVTFDEQEWNAAANAGHRQRFRFTINA